MAIQDCIAAIREALPEVSETEARQIAELVNEKNKRRLASGTLDGIDTELARVAQEEGDKFRLAAALRRKQTAQTIIARDRATQQIDGLVSSGKVDTREAFMAFLVGSIKAVGRARDSISARRASLEAEWIGGMLADLIRDRPHILRMLRRDRAFADDVVREMAENRPGGKSGVTGNDDAVHAARVLSTYAEATRLRLNDAGAFIGKVDGWMPQQHDAGRLMRAGEDAWVASILPRLDLDRSFPDLTGREIRDILSEVYDGIVTGRDLRLTRKLKGEFSGPRNLARSLGKHRVLHFRSADDWLAYQSEFGTPGANVFTSMLAHLGKSARLTSVMEKLGPNPQTMLDSLLEEFRDRIRKNKSLSAGVQKKQLASLDANLENPAGSGKIAKAFAEVIGDTMIPHNVTAAKVSAGIRAVVAMAKLGRAVLRSFPDIVTFSEGLRFQGRPIFATYGDAFKTLLRGKTSAEQREISFLLGTMYDDVIGSIASRWLVDDNLPGAMTKALNGFFRVSGLNWWTERLRSGFTRMSSAWMAMQSSKRWADLDEGYRHVLGLHNIGEARWEALRQMRFRADDGRHYVMPEGVRDLSDNLIDSLIVEDVVRARRTLKVDEAKTPQGRANRTAQLDRRVERLRARARRELESDLRAFFVDEADFAILKGDDRARAFQTQGTKPGTILGEALRFVGQFKAWPILFTQKVLGRTFNSGQRPDMVSIANLIAGMTIMGYLSESAVAITQGKTPPDPSKFETITKAFVTGGAGGIYGDLLLSEYSRFGINPLSTVAGPVIGDAARTVFAFNQLLQGEVETAGKELFFTAIGNVPYANLWFTKYALDYLIVLNLKEAVSPGFIDRLEQRAGEAGQEFFLPLP